MHRKSHAQRGFAVGELARGVHCSPLSSAWKVRVSGAPHQHAAQLLPPPRFLAAFDFPRGMLRTHLVACCVALGRGGEREHFWQQSANPRAGSFLSDSCSGSS